MTVLKVSGKNNIQSIALKTLKEVSAFGAVNFRINADPNNPHGDCIELFFINVTVGTFPIRLINVYPTYFSELTVIIYAKAINHVMSSSRYSFGCPVHAKKLIEISRIIDSSEFTMASNDFKITNIKATKRQLDEAFEGMRIVQHLHNNRAASFGGGIFCKNIGCKLEFILVRRIHTPSFNTTFLSNAKHYSNAALKNKKRKPDFTLVKRIGKTSFSTVVLSNGQRYKKIEGLRQATSIDSIRHLLIDKGYCIKK